MRTLFAIGAIVLLAFAPNAAASRVLIHGQAANVTPTFQIIANPEIAPAELDHEFLRDAFLKKATRWSDGTVIHPADLIPSSWVRKRFSKEVLHRSVESVRSYWQQRIFSGRDVPPPELEGDDEAVAYGLKHEGGPALRDDVPARLLEELQVAGVVEVTERVEL